MTESLHHIIINGTGKDNIDFTHIYEKATGLLCYLSEHFNGLDCTVFVENIIPYSVVYNQGIDVISLRNYNPFDMTVWWDINKDINFKKICYVKIFPNPKDGIYVKIFYKDTSYKTIIREKPDFIYTSLRIKEEKE